MDIEIRTELTKRLADNLPVLRARLDITQQQLAERLGLARNTITAIEKRKMPLSWVNFVALALLFLRMKIQNQS